MKYFNIFLAGTNLVAFAATGSGLSLLAVLVCSYAAYLGFKENA